MIEIPPVMVQPKKPTVLIIGAGLGGLTLAILLEKAGVPYQVYDRMTEIKPFGSAMSIGVNVGPLFKQIGIYDELASLGKVCDTVDNYNEDREKLFSMELGHVLEMTGLQGFIIARSVMHDLMWRQVPTDKIHLGKRVLSMKQNEYGVQIQFSDNTMAEGDILIGADGAYSAVRQSLYARLKKDGLLPSSDDGGLPFSCVYLAGQTNPMNPAMYPELTDPVSRFSSVTSLDKPYSWSSMTVKDNIYCWGVIQYLDSATSKDNDSFRNSEWGPEAAQTMSNEVRDLPLPLGNGKMTMADLIDNSPLISKVMLEEKVFETWYSGRTALLGDACHKIHPAGGTGALNAMHDAVVLANYISTLETTSIEDTERIFQQYKAERYSMVMAAFASAQSMARVRATGWKSRIARYVTRNMPRWLWLILLRRATEYRPQVSFLPLDETQGSLPPKHQPSLEKTLAIHKARAAAAQGKQP